MNINFSDTQRTGILLTIEGDEYLLTYGERNLAHCLVLFIEQAIILEEDFGILDGEENTRVRATDQKLLVTENGVTKEIH